MSEAGKKNQPANPKGSRGLNLESALKRYRRNVVGIAKRLKRRLPAWVPLDDLISYGLFGLYKASQSHPPEQDDFMRRAYKRVLGSMIDGLRASNWFHLQKRGTRVYGKPPVALNEHTDGKQFDRPVVEELDALFALFRRSFLTHQQRYVVKRRVIDRLLFREIAEELGLSEHRVCDIFREAADRMRFYLREEKPRGRGEKRDTLD
jgi:RNA polymerase sigma factor (sigma-70 family)